LKATSRTLGCSISCGEPCLIGSPGLNSHTEENAPSDEPQIMHRGEDGNAFLAQRANQFDHLELASEIQMLHRLVEQQQLGLLCQPQCNFHPPTFASAELVEDARTQRSGICQRHGPFHGFPVRRAQSAEHP
jgi:hypothetical protein